MKSIEINEAVAVKVFGWKKIPGVRYLNYQSISQHTFAEPSHLVPPNIYEKFEKHHKPLDDSSIESPDIPNYCRDIEEAWKVAEYVISDYEDRGYQLSFSVRYDGFCSNAWYCNISIEKQDAVVSHEDPMDGGTVAEAICLAAIKLYTKNESI